MAACGASARAPAAARGSCERQVCWAGCRRQSQARYNDRRRGGRVGRDATRPNAGAGRGEMGQSRFGCGEIDASLLQSQSQDHSGPAASHARVRHHDWPHRRIEDISLATHPFRLPNSVVNAPFLSHINICSHGIQITPWPPVQHCWHRPILPHPRIRSPP